MTEPTPITRRRRYVLVVADEAERTKMAKRTGRKVPDGFDEQAILTTAEAIRTRGLPVDGFELTTAAEAADYFSDAKSALEADEARTAAGTI